jgi:hypothetical protein
MLPGSRIVLEFDLHELPRLLSMTALVRSVVSAADSGKSFTTAILDAAEESAEALQFLHPGACFESSMSWEEMKRY